MLGQLVPMPPVAPGTGVPVTHAGIQLDAMPAECSILRCIKWIPEDRDDPAACYRCCRYPCVLAQPFFGQYFSELATQIISLLLFVVVMVAVNTLMKNLRGD